jgi:hypothetical protein
MTVRNISRPGYRYRVKKIRQRKADDARHQRHHYTDLETIDNEFPDIRVGHHQFEICEIECVFNPEGFFENIEEWIDEKDKKEEDRQPENQCD